MALIAALGLFVSAVMVSVCSRLLADEFKAWTPTIIRIVMKRAALLLPEAQRERYEEEWAGHLNELPGDMGKLVAAAGFLFAASKMSRSMKSMKAMGTVRAIVVLWCIRRWLFGRNPPFVNTFLDLAIRLLGVGWHVALVREGRSVGPRG